MYKQTMLTTVDNPFDPFTQFRKWFVWDVSRNHNTCGYLGRMANFIPESYTDEEYEREVEKAIDKIIKNDIENKYRKLTREIK